MAERGEKRPAASQEPADERLVGAVDGDHIFECTRYVWQNKRQSTANCKESTETGYKAP
jgi:hypothetical protein